MSFVRIDSRRVTERKNRSQIGRLKRVRREARARRSQQSKQQRQKGGVCSQRSLLGKVALLARCVRASGRAGAGACERFAQCAFLGVTKTHGATINHHNGAGLAAAASVEGAQNGGAASNGYANAHHRQKQPSATQARTALQARYEYAYGALKAAAAKTRNCNDSFRLCTLVWRRRRPSRQQRGGGGGCCRRLTRSRRPAGRQQTRDDGWTSQLGGKIRAIIQIAPRRRLAADAAAASQILWNRQHAEF